MQYEPALKKFSEYLVHLETEKQFLSQEGADNGQLVSMLSTIFHDLNEKRQSDMVVENYTIKLKVVGQQSPPPTIQDHDVPVIMAPSIKDHEEKCDLTTAQVSKSLID